MLTINFTHHQSPTNSMADRAQDWRRKTDSRCKYPTSTKGRNPTFINSLMSPASCVLGRDSLLGKVLQPFLLLKKTKAWSTRPCPATHLNTHCRHILGSARQGRDGSQLCSSCHRHCRPSAVTEAAHQLNPPLITGDYNVQLKSSIYMCVCIYINYFSSLSATTVPPFHQEQTKETRSHMPSLSHTGYAVTTFTVHHVQLLSWVSFPLQVLGLKNSALT